MAGAIALSGLAALRGGAGLVQLVVPASCQVTVASFEPSYMVAGMPEDRAGRFSAASIRPVLEFARSATSIGMGPGLGRSAAVRRLVKEIYQAATQPVVGDADALHALANQPGLLDRAAGPRLLTPHPGEFRTLLGIPKNGSREEDEARAVEFAKGHRLVLVLKGHRTLITDGERQVHNTTGNPGMATGGSGDVLTGVICAFLGQGLSPFDAARLGVHIHGRAGDLASRRLGQVSLIASDLVRFLPRALQELTLAEGAD